MNEEPDEYELALRARAGDREALAALVERTRLRLFALAYAELRHYDDAHDAVASALLQICRHIHELREPEKIRAWMQSIVRNEVRRLRRGPDAAVVSLEECDGRTQDAIPSLLRLDIERALRRMPGDQAEVSRMFYLDDLSIRDIARRTGRPEGTIKSWLHRGRQRLALEMEAYAPMAPTPAPEATPAQTAALVHTDLEPALIQKITDSLRTGGYSTKVITPTDPSVLLESLEGYDVIILDERIGAHSAFEFLMHLKARAQSREIPVGLLLSSGPPSQFTASAYFAAGVNRLVNKADPTDMAKLAYPFEKPTTAPYGLWNRFTERARRIVYFAQEEAARLGENWVGTEHLLLGLTRVPDSVGARILERMGVSLEKIQEEVLGQVTHGTGNMGTDMQLTDRAKRVVDFAYDEARQLKNNYIGAEHLLLGLIREGEGLAAQVLVKLGADLERTRGEVQAMQSG